MIKNILTRLKKIFFVQNPHVCPWYCCFSFDNFLRYYVQIPETIVGGFVKPGFTVLDIGPGRGYYSIPMAKMVGHSGKVIVLDIQKKMLEMLKKRALREGVNDTIEYHLVKDSNWEFKGEIDFALAFWMVHEVPDTKVFIKSVYDSLKQGCRFLYVEPYLHVSKEKVETTVLICKQTGFNVVDRPKIFFSRSFLFER